MSFVIHTREESRIEMEEDDWDDEGGSILNRGVKKEHYTVQLEGEDSESERESETEKKQENNNNNNSEADNNNNEREDESEEEEEEGGGYAPINDEDFGDFQGFSDEQSDNVCGFLSQGQAGQGPLPPPPSSFAGPDNKRDEVEVASLAPPNPPASVPVAAVPPAIPPLGADKVELIRAAMAKITIRPPSQGAELLAKRLLDSNLRIGDEVKQQQK